MKKKNIAMMMAGVTVASAVAPAFAAQQPVTTGTVTVNTEKGMEIAGQIREALKVEYQDTKIADNKVGDKVYSVQVSGATVNASQIETQIENLKDGESLTIVVTEKSNTILDGKVVDYKKEGQFKSVDEIVADINKAKTSGASIEIKGKTTTSVEVNKVGKVNETVTINVGDDKVDFTKLVESTDGKLTGFETKYVAASPELTYNIVVKNEEE